MHLKRTHTPFRFPVHNCHLYTNGWKNGKPNASLLLPFYRFIRSFSNKIHIFAASLLCVTTDTYRWWGCFTVARKCISLLFIHCFFVGTVCAACVCTPYLLFCFDAVALSLANIGIFTHTHTDFTVSIKNKIERIQNDYSCYCWCCCFTFKLFGQRSFDFCVRVKEWNNGRNYYRHHRIKSHRWHWNCSISCTIFIHLELQRQSSILDAKFRISWTKSCCLKSGIFFSSNQQLHAHSSHRNHMRNENFKKMMVNFVHVRGCHETFLDDVCWGSDAMPYIRGQHVHDCTHLNRVAFFSTRESVSWIIIIRIDSPIPYIEMYVHNNIVLTAHKMPPQFHIDV